MRIIIEPGGGLARETLVAHLLSPMDPDDIAAPLERARRQQVAETLFGAHHELGVVKRQVDREDLEQLG